MSHPVVSDQDFNNVARVINALDPVNDQDYITVNWIKSLIKRVTTPQARSINTYADVTQLVSGVLPVGNYSIRVVASTQSASGTSGVGMRLGVGTAVVANMCIDWRLPLNANLSLNQTASYTQLLPTDNQFSTSIGAANTNFATVGLGFFSVTTQGTVAVQFRPETNGTALTVGVGSFMIIERLP